MLAGVFFLFFNVVVGEMPLFLSAGGGFAEVVELGSELGELAWVFLQRLLDGQGGFVEGGVGDGFGRCEYRDQLRGVWRWGRGGGSASACFDGRVEHCRGDNSGIVAVVRRDSDGWKAKVRTSLASNRGLV